MDGEMDGWMDGWIGGWIDGWMDGWMDGSMYAYLFMYAVFFILKSLKAVAFSCSSVSTWGLDSATRSAEDYIHFHHLVDPALYALVLFPCSFEQNL